MRRVIVESPFAAPTPEGVERNLRYVRACMRDCVLRGESPYASHALLTQLGVLDDTKPEERELGIRAGFAWRQVAEATVIYIDLGTSNGMQRGDDDARAQLYPVEYRRLGGEWGSP